MFIYYKIYSLFVKTDFKILRNLECMKCIINLDAVPKTNVGVDKKEGNIGLNHNASYYATRG